MKAIDKKIENMDKVQNIKSGEMVELGQRP